MKSLKCEDANGVGIVRGTHPNKGTIKNTGIRLMII